MSTMPGLSAPTCSRAPSPQEIPQSDQLSRSIVFLDLSVSPVETLKELFKACRASATVGAVLDSCQRGIDAERALLSHHDSESIPSFRTIRDLAYLPESIVTGNSAVGMVLSTTAQLCCFARLAEQEPSLLSSTRKNVSFVGLCAGIIAAATTAASTSLADIVLLSQAAVRVAFRAGMQANQRAQVFYKSQGSCALAVLGGMQVYQVEKLIEEFNARYALPHHRKLYISAVLPSSCTISGSPPDLSILQSFEAWASDVKFKPISIFAPFHASHLAVPDVDQLVNFTELEHFRLKNNVSLIASQHQSSFSDLTLKAILKDVLTNLFQSRMTLEATQFKSSTDFSWQKSDFITFIEPSGPASSNIRLLDLDEQKFYQVAGPGSREDATRAHLEDEVAVIGMAGRFPGADTLEEYWDIIVSGRDVHQYIPDDRFNARASYDQAAAGRNTTASPFGCFMKRPGMFDPAFFNLSPREAKQIDPQHRLLLMVTQEALEMAGYSGAGQMRVGTFFGQATDDWRESHTRQDIDIFYVGAGMRAFAPGRLNYHYKWDGPSYSVDTACSSSLAALELACKAIRSGDCDLAVAGGGNLCTALPMFSGLSKGKFTSPSGSCKTFCSNADGYCRGEAVGAVVLQRLADARAQNTNIHGTVAGIVTNHSARASSITHPHAETQQTLMLEAIRSSGLNPSDIDYVEFHGTGTKAGDKAEITSVSRVFDEDSSRTSTLYIGAVKANVGHGEAAAGITSLIKGLLMMRQNKIPPHCGIKSQLSSDVELAMSSILEIPQTVRDFSCAEGKLKNILINNFNATGGNTCMVLREASQTSCTLSADLRNSLPFAISGQTPKAMQNNITKLRKYLDASSIGRLADISYTLTARRLHYKYRKAVTAATFDELKTSIDALTTGSEVQPTKCTPRVAFVFAGQGTQVQGIVAELFATSPFFRSTLQNIEAMCSSLSLPKFIDFLIKEQRREDEWSPVQLQIATVAVELALARLWQNWGVKPSFVMGHSLGEYTALCIAGVISEADVFTLVGRRAQLLEELCHKGTHTMLSVQSSPDEITGILSSCKLYDCEISCYNSHHAVTLSGTRESLDILKSRISERNIKSTFLNVEYAFHSPNIEPMLERFEQAATLIQYNAPTIPVMSTLSGEEIVQAGTFGARYLANQARKPVNFMNAMHNSCQSHEDVGSHQTIWIEFGPGNPACLSFIRSSVAAEHRTEVLPSLSARKPTWESVSHNITKCYESGVNVDWQSFHKDYERSLKLLELPSYAFDLQELWIPLQSVEYPQKDNSTPAPKITPLLHRLQTGSLENAKGVARFESDLDDAHLFDLIRGHLVMGSPLCPSSVYCAMAMSAAQALASKNSSSLDQGTGWMIENMRIHQPLIPQQGQAQIIQLSTSSKSDSSPVSFAFTSQTKNKSSVDHAQVSLQRTGSAQWISEWSKIEFLVSSRMQQLESLQSDEILRITKPVIYKLFTHVVVYSSPFQGIQSMTLDTSKNEAVAEVRFGPTEGSEENLDVQLIDSVMHFAGFVLNNGIEDDDDVFISDGWDSLRMLPEFNRKETCKYYTKMNSSGGDQSFSGDVYAFSKDRIVACCNEVRFRKMRKQSLRSILSRYAPAEKILPKEGVEGLERDAIARRKDMRESSVEKEPLSRGQIEEQLKQILASEAGIEGGGITSSTAIAGLGVDSILMMSIIDKIEGALQVDVPSQEAAAAIDFEAFKTVIMSSYDQQREAMTPEPSQNLLTDAVAKLGEEKPSQNRDANSGSGSKVTSIIAKHAGVSEEQVEQCDNFSSLGIDSLLSLDIVDQMQKEIGEAIPASFLQDHPNAESLHRRFGMADSKNSGKGSTRTSGSITPVYEGTNPSPLPRCSAVSKEPNKSPEVSRQEKLECGSPTEFTNERICRMRLIQGSSRSSSPPIFFLPPGDGTATIYTKLPKHPDDTAIYTPESPFADEPHHPENTFGNVSQAYQSAIRKAYLKGPYHIAGYSVGGAYAFEVARLLLKEGFEVDSLTIIDCPSPRPPLEDGLWFGLEALLMVGFADYLLGLLPNLTVELLEHTAAAAREFNRHSPLAFEDRKPGKVSIIWSTHGSQEELIQRCIAEQRLLDQTTALERSALIEQRRRVADMSWCNNKRTDLGPQGWDQWVGKDVRYEVMEGTHFSVAVEPALSLMAELVYQCISQATVA